MAFEELRERLSGQLKDLGARIQDSPAFQTLKEKFDDLPSNQQKIVVVGVTFLLTAFVFSFPYENWSLSSDNVVEFEDRRQLIRDLLKVNKETSEIPSLPPAPEIGQIKTDIEMRLQQFQLQPEQLGGVSAEMPQNSNLIPSGRQEGIIKVVLKKLNLRQVVDITSQLQSMQAAMKLRNFNLNSNLQDPRYLDAAIDFIIIKIPQISMEPAEEPARPPRGRGRK